MAGVLFEDDFSAGDGQWVVIAGEWEVQDGALTETAVTPYAIAVAGDASWTDYTVELDVTLADNDADAGGSHDCVGILIRTDDVGENGYRFWVRTDASGPGQFVKWIDKTWDQGGSLTPLEIDPVEVGKVYNFRAVVEGNRIQCFIDDVAVVDYEEPDTSFQLNGKIGLITYKAKQPVFDNIEVTSMDDTASVEAHDKLGVTWGEIKVRY
ncbi:family 16 glycoside hydrolase [Candidatus Poribacteria bacterium]